MTQKELLYFEDAVGHETSIIKICNDIINALEDENLIDFMNEEVVKHNTMKTSLINLMEEKSNE